MELSFDKSYILTFRRRQKQRLVNKSLIRIFHQLQPQMRHKVSIWSHFRRRSLRIIVASSRGAKVSKRSEVIIGQNFLTHEHALLRARVRFITIRLIKVTQKAINLLCLVQQSAGWFPSQRQASMIQSSLAERKGVAIQAVYVFKRIRLTAQPRLQAKQLIRSLDCLGKRQQLLAGTPATR
jgi:hypothetical protein